MKNIDLNPKAVARDLVAALKPHDLTQEQAVKCLIYTSTKILAVMLKSSDRDAAIVLSKACLAFEEDIARAERMFQNRG